MAQVIENIQLWKTRTRLWYIVNNMAAGDLATEGIRETAV